MIDVGTIQNYEPDPVLDEPRFLLGDVAAAAGLTDNVIKAWLTRGEPPAVPMGPYDQKALGKGSSRVFTLRRVIALAITAELVRLGLPPSRAGLLAYTLTDINLEKFGADVPDEDATLIAYPDSEIFSIVPKSAEIGEMFRGLPTVSLEAEAGQASFVAVNYGAVKKRVIERLRARGKET